MSFGVIVGNSNHASPFWIKPDEEDKNHTWKTYARSMAANTGYLYEGCEWRPKNERTNGYAD